MNIIEQLNNIKLEDLGKFDYAKMVGQLRNRPDLIINIVAILLTALALHGSFRNSANRLNDLLSERSQLETKVEQVKKYTQTKSDLDAILENIPPVINGTRFVSFVTDLANQEHIQIISLNPTPGESTRYSDVFRIDLSIIAPDYKTLLRFLYALEHSTFAIRIDNWSAEVSSRDTPQETGGSTADSTDSDPIQSQLILMAVNIKKI